MTILLSRRTIFALACGLALAGGQFVFAGTDTTSPRVVSVEPGPAAGVVDQLGLDEIQVGFDETVMIPRGSITVWTVGGGPVRGLASSFDIGTNVLTITLPRAIQTDRVTLVLDYTITDMAGNPLDGEIFDPTDPFLPSGNSHPVAWESSGSTCFRAMPPATALSTGRTVTRCSPRSAAAPATKDSTPTRTSTRMAVSTFWM